MEKPPITNFAQVLTNSLDYYSDMEVVPKDPPEYTATELLKSPKLESTPDTQISQSSPNEQPQSATRSAQTDSSTTAEQPQPQQSQPYYAPHPSQAQPSERGSDTGIHPLNPEGPVTDHNANPQPTKHEDPNQQWQQTTSVGPSEDPNVKPLAMLRRDPLTVYCPLCRRISETYVTPKVGTSAHVYAGVLCLFTLSVGWIMYIVKAAKDREHRCGRCGSFLATWNRFNDRTDVHMHVM
ncbi:MAG: hypothetical protein M1831_003348 [Alyxoria varia]|nr:MAG: hypothetical protein M1831_003348 [Alyxoria varia]